MILFVLLCFGDFIALLSAALIDGVLWFLDLWAAKLNLKGRSSLASQEELAEYERRKEQMDIELERRKELGEKFSVRYALLVQFLYFIFALNA